MSYHIISIDASPCQLSCSKGQLTLSSPEGERRVPMEDVGAIIITSYKCELSNHFLIEACRHRIGLIICEQFKPAAIVLPANRITDTKIIRHLAHLPSQLKQRLWEKTVTAKCTNQHLLAQQWTAEHPLLDEMRQLAQGQKRTREAECAKRFWKIFAETHHVEQFRRGRFEDGYNALFNYAYAILLSCMLQRLLALGLDPSFGIFHLERPHATPLGYDLMEPLRVLFDANVSRWIQRQLATGHQAEDICQISSSYRQHITATLKARIEYEGRQLEVCRVIELVVASFREAISTLQTSPYHPWTISTIKWAG